MKLAKRNRDETITVTDRIENITGLENSQLIKMDRGDKLNKDLKRAKARTCFGEKGLYSVKEIKSALEEIASMNAKSSKFNGCWCMVCVENWTHNESGICNECKLS